MNKPNNLLLQAQVQLTRFSGGVLWREEVTNFTGDKNEPLYVLSAGNALGIQSVFTVLKPCFLQEKLIFALQESFKI